MQTLTAVNFSNQVTHRFEVCTNIESKRRKEILTEKENLKKDSFTFSIDGNFPNHIPNPENKEAMNSIREATLKVGADIGIIFDTDVDRAAVVDSKGNEINRDRLIALLAGKPFRFDSSF